MEGEAVSVAFMRFVMASSIWPLTASACCCDLRILQFLDKVQQLADRICLARLDFAHIQ